MYGSPDKIAKLEQLAILRKEAAWTRYKNIADFDGGIYDSRHVSPYTRGAGNCDAPIFLLLQDWCSAEYLARLKESEKETLAELGMTPGLPTNRNLERLLNERLGMTLKACYATNLLPFIKSGKMSNAIEKGDLRRAAKEYAIPQIRIVRPKQVICLGGEVFRSVRHALGLTLQLGRDSQVGKCFVCEGIRIWCQAHPGWLGCASRGGLEELLTDWATMVGDPSFEV